MAKMKQGRVRLQAEKKAKPVDRETPVAVPMQELVPNPGGEEKYGARASAAKTCKFCGHDYLKPCTDKTKDACPNFKHLQGSKKK